MNLLKESTVQNAAIEWLQELGYAHQVGNSLDRKDLKKVVLQTDLRIFLSTNYPKLSPAAIDEAIAIFTQQEGMEVAYRNHDFHKKMTQGVSITWKDAQGKEYAEHIYPINYADVSKNKFVCVDELTIIGKNTRRTDLLIFINGLPIIFFEFKNPFDATVGVGNAHTQLENYILDIPQIFDYNAISILSDGRVALHGMFTSAMEWFAPWKSLQGDDTQQNEDLQLATLLKGLFPKATLLNYLKNFIFHEDHNGKLIKKGAKYHQYWGITKAVVSAQQHTKPKGDGRLGVIWHTQGSGKSISMAILTGILRTLPEMKNPTIVIQVDRATLDQQLYDNFVLAKDLVGEVQHADTTEELRALLSTDGGGVIFTTIEKFRLKKIAGTIELRHPILSERYNLIVMADEAHRTQYGFKDGGFAQNIRRALPNASFIGFTGTPVDSKTADTTQVFGKTIHTYDIEQAVKDGATVPIYYEPKMVPLHIKGKYAQDLEAIAEAVEGSQTTAVWAAVEDAAGAVDRVAKVATDILNHFQKRTKTLEGKAMIVCMSRRNCVKMYDALTALADCPEIAVIMTSNVGKDPKEWNPHFRTKANRKVIKKRFKDPNDPLKMVIVRDMWLTGFDAPCAHTMYVDKIMKGHNLMQAIARVNRVFEDKPNGLVVDFIGISGNLATATKKYTHNGGEGKPTLDLAAAVRICLLQFDKMCRLLDDFDFEEFEKWTDGQRMTWSNERVNDILKTEATTDYFLQEERKLSELVAMTSSDPKIWAIQMAVGVLQKNRETVRKIKFPPALQRKKSDRIKDLISQSLASNTIVDLATMYDLEKIDISIIDARFQAIAKEKGSENIKIALLQRIINDELAFYDLLAANEKLLNTKGPMQDLVHKVVYSVKKNLQLDWTKKENAKAAIRLAVKKELRGKVPFSALDKLLKEVIEQAEGQYRDWPMVG